MAGGGVEAPASEVRRNRLEALERRHSLRTPAKVRKATTPTANRPPTANRAGSAISNSSAVERSSSSSTPAIYAPLGQSILNGDVGTQLQLGAKQGDVRSLLRDVWPKSSRESLDATMERVANHFVSLDNPTTGTNLTAKARPRSGRSSKHLSLAKHRQLGSFRLERRYMRYELYAPLQSMWKDYVNRLVSGCNESSVLQARLLTCELHGAVLEVADSSNKSFNGVKGIMIRETEKTLGILTQADKFRVVPKAGSVFVLQLDELRVVLFGKNLTSRSLQTGTPRKKKTEL